MQSDRMKEGVKETRNPRLKWKRMDEEMRNNGAAVSNSTNSQCVNHKETEAKLS